MSYSGLPIGFTLTNKTLDPQYFQHELMNSSSVKKGAARNLQKLKRL